MKGSWHGLTVIARREFVSNLRSVRMVILMVIFSLLVLFTIYVGSLFLSLSGPLPGLEQDTLSQGPAIVLWFVSEFIVFIGPILALALSFDVIVREKVQNSLALLLSRPVSRQAIALGKFLGVFGSLALPVVVVNSLAVALAVALSGKGIGIDQTVGFLLLTLLFLGTYLAIGQLISSLAKTTTTAILAGIGVWFFFWLFLWILQVILRQEVVSLFNPGTAYSACMGALLVGISPGSLLPLWGYYALTVAWMVAPLLVAVVVFDRKDE